MSLSQLLQRARITWHGAALGHPDWSDGSHAIAFGMESVRGTFRFHIILNAYWEALSFEMPRDGDVGRPWRRCMDTAEDPPNDICPWQEAPVVTGGVYRAHPRSVVVLAQRLVDE
jgi:glycogen operon protein